MEQSIILRERFRIDRMWFFFMFATGAASIVLLDVFKQEKLYSIVISAAVIIVYAVAASIVPRLRARPDQVADNSYYLGLLFTLVSLSLALIRFASVEGTPGNSSDATDAIIRNFGIAISSTIVGLALRVLVAQFREDPADLEQEARLALAVTVRKLRGDLDQASAEMQRFVDGVRQALQETAVEANKKCSSAIEKSASKFEKATDRISVRMTATADTFEVRSETLENAIGRMASALEALSGRVAAVRADDDLVEAAVKVPLDTLAASLERLEDKVDEEAERLERGATAIAAVEGAVGSLTAAAQGLAETAVAVSTSAGSLGAVNDGFADLAQSISSATASSDGFAKNIAGAAAADFTKASAALAALETKLAAIGTAAEARVHGIDTALAELREGLEKVRSDFSLSGETIERVRAEMADLAGFIIKRLETQ
jgi:hypothetical protein